VKEKVTTFDLVGGASIWWEYLKKVNNISKNKMTWKQSERFFRKVKELHGHKLGKLTMDKYVRILLELLSYVPYIKD
jgi:hypothetical protein